MKTLLKKIYGIVPFRKALFSLLKRFTNLSPNVYQHLHFRGFFSIPVSEGKSFRMFHHGSVEENVLFWGGLENGWEKLSIHFWTKLAENSNVIFDIGANTGIYALVAKTVNPAATIHCFEPLPGVFRYLEKNAAKNKFDISLHEYALSDYNGTASVYLQKGQDFAYSVTVNKNTLNTENVDILTIQTKTLAAFIEENNITGIDLMKVDVETHEAEVLQGMGSYLEQFQPAMLIEILNDEVVQHVNQLLSGFDYLYFNIDDEKNTFRRTETIGKSDFWNYLVCKRATARQLGLI